MKKANHEAKAAEMTSLMSALEAFQEEIDPDDVRIANKIERFEAHYSERNALLIVMQRPNATEVHGYGDWQKLGRQVTKGAKGIRILAPAGHAKVTDKVTGEEKDGRAFFRLISVFDKSQTEAKENVNE